MQNMLLMVAKPNYILKLIFQNLRKVLKFQGCFEEIIDQTAFVCSNSEERPIFTVLTLETMAMNSCRRGG